MRSKTLEFGIWGSEARRIFYFYDLGRNLQQDENVASFLCKTLHMVACKSVVHFQADHCVFP